MTDYPILQSIESTLNIKEIVNNSKLTSEIQNLLKEGGFLSGKIDGVFGIQTNNAFIAFKEAAFLQYPNLLGKSTATALLELDDKAIHPIPSEATKVPIPMLIKDKNFRLPGGEVIFCKQKIMGCQSFTWGEATKEGSRIPESSIIVTRIIEIAEYLEIVKNLFNNYPIFITSWYRPKSINDKISKVSNSRHLKGDAVDFIVQGIPPLEVYKRLHNWHGSKGGLGKSTEFTHLDLRGYYARWSYR